jgi:hypothetical protein
MITLGFSAITLAAVTAAGSTVASEEEPAGRASRARMETGATLDSLDLDVLAYRFAVNHASSYAGIDFNGARMEATIFYKAGTDSRWLTDAIAGAAAVPFTEQYIVSGDGLAGSPGKPDTESAVPDEDPDADKYTILVDTATFSSSELDQARSQFVASDPLGEHVVKDRIVASENKLEITLSGITADDVRLVQARTFAPDRLDILVDEEFGIPTRSIGRRDDIAPHWSGIVLDKLPGDGLCTGGFTVQNDAGTRRSMITAGHCGLLGTQWANTNGTFVGEIVVRAFAPNGFDSARLTKPGMPLGFGDEMYVGGPSSTNHYDVIGAYSHGVDDPICVSGAFGGSACGATVVERDVCVTAADGVRTCHTNVTDDDLGTVLGDSGAPMYIRPASASVRIGGQFWGFARGCCVFYHPVGMLLNRFGTNLLIDA